MSTRLLRKSPKTPLLLFLLVLVSSYLIPRNLIAQQVAAEPKVSIPDLQKKAENGDPEAQLALAKAYDNGGGVAQSDNLAAKWYRTSADQGNATAQNNLGLMYRTGRGVEQSKEEAVTWYRKAAKQNHASAMFNIGTAYYNGDGVAIDDTTAYAWFLLAKEFGSEPAVDAVERMRTDFSSRELQAFVKVGDMYSKGDEIQSNKTKAIDWYRKAATNDGPEVKVKLALLLLQPTDPKSYDEVRNLCEQAAAMQSAPGAYCVSLLYEKGWGVPMDSKLALKWLAQAADLGHPVAMMRLGQIYWNGAGVKQDKILAYKYALLASTTDLPDGKAEKEAFEKEMTAKQIKQGRAKAIEWNWEHKPLMLRKGTMKGIEP